MTQTRPVAGPRALFDRLMQCLMADDREQQLSLYAEDCVWEFPFAAGDRPRRMEGREAVRRAMTPLWEQARQAGARVIGFEPLAIHETSDPEVIVAEFHLQVEVQSPSPDVASNARSFVWHCRRCLSNPTSTRPLQSNSNGSPAQLRLRN